MAEGDTILRAAHRIERALAGQELAVRAGNGRGRASGVERLDGRRLERVGTHGKHLLLGFGELTLHSHLGMGGSWQVSRRGERWRKQATAAWVVLSGSRTEAVQFGGPTIRVLVTRRLTIDSVLARLGPDILAPDFDLDAGVRRLRAAGPGIDGGRRLGEALLDQTSIAGIGNIFQNEACFAARVSPRLPIADLSDVRLAEVVAAARRLMRDAVEHGRRAPAVYGRAGRPCPRCRTPIEARGQGDANRRTYWCPRCQAGESRAK